MSPRSTTIPAVDAFGLAVYDRTGFVLRFFAEVARPPLHLRELVRQSYQVGYRSLALVSVTGFVIGIVFTAQSRPSLAEFGATSWLPSLMTIAMVKALAPLITGLIFAGRVGSSIGAELGSMTVTEQVEAMEVSGINPFKYLVVTRVLASTLMSPVLTLYCALVGLIGAYVNILANESTSVRTFIETGFAQVSMLDLSSSLFRGLVFGFTISIIACYQGLHASKGTRGVGMAANSSVVLGIFAIFIEEALIVQFVSWLR